MKTKIILKNRDFLYPILDDPDFNIKIAGKKEFYDTMYKDKLYNIKERGDTLCGETEFELSPTQMFVRNFLSFQTPYNNLLLFHGLGTGKTCSAIVVTEEMRKFLKEMGISKRIIIVASPNVQNNFRLQLFDERKLHQIDGLWNLKACTGNTFIKEINPMGMKGFSKFKIIKQIKRIINISYLFMGYTEFSNYIQRIKHRNAIEKEFSNRLIVIDEVHNIRSTSDNKQRKIGANMLQLVKKAKDLKLLLLSATPMFNSCKEIIWLLNLMNLNDKRLPLKIKDVFDKEGDFLIDDGGKNIGKELLIEKCRGYISFMRGEIPYTFPYRIYPSLFTKDNILSGYTYPKKQINGLDIIENIHFLDLKLVDISEFQKQNYLQTVEKIKDKFPSFEKMENGLGYTVLEAPLQVLNITYPTEKMYGLGALEEVMKYRKTDKTDFLYKNDILKNHGRIFQEDKIGIYSCKMEAISKAIRKSTGIIMIYSQYIGGGCIPLALMLEEMGFQRYGRNNLFKGGYIDIKSIGNYAMITGDSILSPNNEKEIKACTNQENIYGEKVRVIIISKAASEGLDFKNVRQLHVMEPWYNLNRIEQIIGRAVRYCSHKDLPFKERNVEIYLYGTKMDEIEAVDLYIYRLAEKKSIKISAVARLLKENAIDCLLNKGQVNLSEKRINQDVKILLSSGKEINYRPGDKPYSSLCDFMEKCEYVCNPEREIKINEDTYDEKFIIMNLEKMIRIIKNLMKEHYIYRKDHLIMAINRIKQYPLVQIYAALDQLIKDRNEFITDPLGRLGHLINIADYYMFQPLELDTERLTYYQRTRPIDIRKEKLRFKVNMKFEESVRNDVESIIKQMEEEFTKVQNPTRINKGVQDWYIFCSLAFPRLEISKKVLNGLVLEHIIEMHDTKVLMDYLYYSSSTLTQFETMIKKVLDNRIISIGKINVFLFVKNNILQTMILDTKKSRPPLATEEIEIEEYIKKKKITNVNDIIGYMSIFKKEYVVFKIKNFNETRNRGARCDQIYKKNIIPLLNKIIDGNEKVIKKYTMDNIFQKFPEETKDMKIHLQQLCCEMELILRYYDKQKVNGKRWFLSLVESTILKIN